MRSGGAAEAPPLGDDELTDDPARWRSGPRLASAGGVVTVVVSAWLSWWGSFDLGGRTFTFFDDALVSMTFARNLARGDGLRWNAGEPAVEGITTPLWTLVMAIPHALGLDRSDAVVAMIVAGVVVLVLATMVAADLAHQVLPERPSSARWAAVLVGAYFPLVFWTVRGMEVGFFTLLVLLLVDLALRVRRGGTGRELAALAIVAGVGMLTRIDFVVPLAAVGMWVLATAPAEGRRRIAGLVGGATAAAIVVQTAARLAYYGAVLPNTYYLKLDGLALSIRLPRGGAGIAVLVGYELLFAFVVVGLARPWADRRLRSFSGLVALVVGSAAAYSWWVGGDTWDAFGFPNRFLTPSAALLLVLVAVTMPGLAERARCGPAPLALPLLLGVVAFLVIDEAAALPVATRTSLDLIFFHPTISTARAMAVSVLLAVAVAAAWWSTSRAASPRSPNRLMSAGSVERLVTAIVVLGVLATSAINPIRRSEFILDGDAESVGLGVLIRELTDEDAHVAVVGAGAPIYFADRLGVDIMGKSDPVIARMPAHDLDVVTPGHVKWDYTRSIGELRPDLIAQLWTRTDEDLAYLRELGYRPARPIQELRHLEPPRSPFYAIFVLEGSTHVHWERLVVEQASS